MKKNIPFCDLTRAHDPIRTDITKAISNCIDQSSFLRGPQTQAFEQEWAEFCGQSYAVCCNSGTDALTLAALALNLKDARIQANTLPLTGIGLHLGGAQVTLAEINQQGWIDQASAQDVPVLLFGQLPKTDAPHSILYDAAHAHGWQPPQTSAAAWSFYPTKTLGAMGDAGAITTNDKYLANAMRDLCGRDDQLREKRQITSRIDEIQAAILRVKLKHLNEWLAQRQSIGDHYNKRLNKLGITLNTPSLHHLYVIQVAARENLMCFLQERGIATKIHWDKSLNQINGPWQQSGTYHQANTWADCVLSLPCFPGLRAHEVDYVCDAIEQYYLQETATSHPASFVANEIAH